jgi:hypothetical protein
MPTIKAKIWIRVVPAIQKDLMMTLFNCKGTFEINTLKHTFFIWDVSFFNLDESGDNGMYRIQVYTDNNTKDIFIDKLNVLEFTLHFL